MKPTGSGPSAKGGPASRTLTAAVVILLILSAYVAIQMSGLQGQVSSLQNQNSNLQFQITNLENQQNYLQSQLNRLLTASTQTSVRSFYLQDVCVSVAPLCYSYTGHQGTLVYGMIIVNNGTVTIPVTSSVSLEFKDGTRSTYFAFNTTLPSDIYPGSGVYLNSTSWPAGTNATSKMAPGDDIGLAVFVESLEVSVETHVATCSSSTTTFQNYTIMQTETITSCSY